MQYKMLFVVLALLITLANSIQGGRIVICDSKRVPGCCTATGPDAPCTILDTNLHTSYQYSFNTDSRCASGYTITELWQGGQARGQICATAISKASGGAQIWMAALWINDPYYNFHFEHQYNATVYH